MEEVFSALVPYVDVFFFIFFAIINLVYAVLLLVGALTVYRRKQELNFEDLEYLLHSNSLPEIAFIIPSYNEGDDLIMMIDNLINLSYRYKKIIVVNDGSTDNTMETTIKKYELIKIAKFYKDELPTKHVRGIYKSLRHPELIILDKENGQKQDALNAGLNACSNHFFIGIDADTFIDDSSFAAIVQPMLTSPKLAAMGVSVRIRNGCTFSFRRVTTFDFPQNFWASVQSLEYLRSFLMRQGWNYFGGNVCLSGAFGIFVTDIVKKAGGYADTFTNDLEITLRLNRVLLDENIEYKIVYIPDPAAWTDVPTSYKVLSNQRSVWHRGTMECGWFHRIMFFNPKYKQYGLFAFPFLIFSEIVEPIVELLGYLYIFLGLYLGVFTYNSVLLLFFIIWVFTFAFTIFCIFIEEITFNKYPSLRTIFLLFLTCLVENFGYRQMTILWRMHGMIEFFKHFKETSVASIKVNAAIAKSVEEYYEKKSRS